MGNLFNKNDYDATVQRIQQLGPETKAQWGKMNVNEMICHLSDPLRDVLGDRPSKRAVPLLLRPVLRMIVLGKKPFSKNLPTLPSYLQSDKGKGTPVTGFEPDRQQLLQLLQRFHSAPADFAFQPHPGPGKLSREQNGFFVWKHFDHHLRQFGV